jgi:hypothetical protein
MSSYTADQLDRVRNERLPQLHELGNYSGSYVTGSPGQSPSLVVQFHPVTPEITRRVKELFGEVPVEVVDRPVASAYVVRKAP